MTTNQSPIKGVACSFKGKMYCLPAPYRHSDVIRAIKLLNPTMKMFKGDQGFVDPKDFSLQEDKGLILS